MKDDIQKCVLCSKVIYPKIQGLFCSIECVLRDEVKTLKQQNQQIADKLNFAREQAEKMRHALKYYANPVIYTGVDYHEKGYCLYSNPPIMNDGGELARQVL